MKIQPDMVKLQEFQVHSKRRQMVQLDRMIDDFEQMVRTLEEQIQSQQHQNGNNHHEHFVHTNFTKAARERRDNLHQSLKDLKKQRQHAAVELAEIEAKCQKMLLRKPPFRQENHSARSAVV